MLVSAIMPTRSRPALSMVALRSFLAQTYDTKELIILDDMDDPSFAEAPDFAGVRYLRMSRMCVGAKRNVLCEHALGELIVHWDSDDWSAPNRIEEQVKGLTASGRNLTGYHSLLIWDERTNLGYRWANPEKPFACGTSMCYRKTFWERNHFPDVQHSEDNAFVNRAKERGVALVSEDGGKMMVARAHGANTSSCQRIGNNCWPLVDRSEFPKAFFEAIQ